MFLCTLLWWWLEFLRCFAVPLFLSALVRYLTLAQAQAKAFVVDWKDPINKPIKPRFIGTKAFKRFPIQDVVDYIDWNPFFQVNARPNAHSKTAQTSTI